MFFTLLRLGSLEEAKYALRAYLGLMNVPDFDTGFTLDDMHETINPEEKDSVTDQSKPLTTISKANCIIRRLSDCLGESIGRYQIIWRRRTKWEISCIFIGFGS
jgi:hypothetical protein